MYPLFHTITLLRIIPFLSGWLLDRLLGDPEGSPHPVVFFGKLISRGENKLNNGDNRFIKGTLLASFLIIGTFIVTDLVLKLSGRFHPYLAGALITVGVFYCLAGKTLIREVTLVFEAVQQSTEEGRKQLSRIVGRDTANLSPHEIRTAALETLSENLSDGVIAPMFWFAIAGLPGMMAYKMTNTLDSMIGYKNERYLEFGRAAAKTDDIANYIPARLTAYLMLIVSGNWNKRSFVSHYGSAHASPNSGYPEAALAGILDCQFGGTHDYFGQPVKKPFIGTNNRPLHMADLTTSIQVFNHTELIMGIIVTAYLILNIQL